MKDFKKGKQDALSVLREVAAIAEDTSAATIAKKLYDERIPRLEDERFHLVVLGEFNHGKTTFVNALLGKALLPAGVTPTTAVIHHIVHGETPAARVVMTDGVEQPLAIDGLTEYVVGGKAARDDVAYVEVEYPSPLLQGGIVLVDTPGVNDLNLSRAEVTYSYISRADAVVFLLDAGQILKESERAFIAQKLLASARDKVLFVVNKIDLIGAHEREDAMAYARTNLAKIISEPRLYAVSAQRALAGDRVTSGFDAFAEELGAFLSDERGRILLDNALDEGLRAGAMLRTGIEIQRRALAMDQDQLARRLADLEADLSGAGQAAGERERKVRESLAAVKAIVRRDVEAFAKRFAAALPAEIESSKADELKKYLPGFIEERFKKFAEQQGEDVAKRLEKVAEEAITFLAEDIQAQTKRLEDLLGPSAPKLDLQVNTFAYDVGVFALGAFGIGIMALANVFVGGALALAAPVLAYVFRGRADKEVKRRAAEEAPAAVREAAGKMADAFDKHIDEFGDKLVKFIESASEELTRSIAEVLRAAQGAKREGDDARDRLESKTGMALARLGGVEQKMQSMRAALWANGKDAAAG